MGAGAAWAEKGGGRGANVLESLESDLHSSTVVVIVVWDDRCSSQIKDDDRVFVCGCGDITWPTPLGVGDRKMADSYFFRGTKQIDRAS